MRNVRFALGRRWTHDHKTAGGLDVGKRRHNRQQRCGKHLLSLPFWLFRSVPVKRSLVFVEELLDIAQDEEERRAQEPARERSGVPVCVPDSWFWGRISVHWRGRACAKRLAA